MGKEHGPKENGTAHPAGAVSQKAVTKLCSFEKDDYCRSDESTLCLRKAKERRNVLPTCRPRSDEVPLRGKGSRTPLLLDRIEAILCEV